MKPIQSRRLTAVAAAVAGGLALSSCMTATPYAPATGSGSYRTGYWDEQIEPERFRVTFAGNSITSRETVERYLLYRAAQLTLEHGADYFTLAGRDTEKKTRVSVDPYWGGPYGYGGYGYWGPSWRYWGYRGWSAWGPWGYPGFGWGGSYDVSTIDRYEASAEIVLGHGQKPPTELRAFDARAVVASTGPNIQLPPTK
jgi:hypothetical protein